MDDQSHIVAAEAAVTAVLEPPRRRFFSRRRKVQPPPSPYCENCGAPMAGPFCAQCGQAAIDYRRSFRHIIVDVLDSFLNWDSKFFATIGWLIARPWHLTNQFLAGRRVRYVHPLRLYLLASILFFFVVNYWAKSLHVDPSKLSTKDRAEIEADISTDKDVPPEARAKIEKALQLKSPTPAPAPQDAASPVASAVEEPKKKESETKNQGDFGPLLQMGSDEPSNSLGKWLMNRAKEKMGEHGTKMGLFIATLFNNLPYMMLACIPLFAFVLKILYIRRRVFYVDHLVYALHIHTFAYVAIMLIVLITIGLNRSIPGTFAGWIIAALCITFAAQVFLSIRRVYRQGWFFTIFKFFVGGFVYLIVLCIALAATFFVTLALPS
jgi:Protein of unknown function (DUF3667)